MDEKLRIISLTKLKKADLDKISKSIQSTKVISGAGTDKKGSKSKGANLSKKKAASGEKNNNNNNKVSDTAKNDKTSFEKSETIQTNSKKKKNLVWIIGVIAIGCGVIWYQSRDINPYETYKEHKAASRLSSDNRIDYYLAKAEEAYLANDDEYVKEFYGECFNTKSSLQPFIHYGELCAENNEMQVLLTMWLEHQEDWKSAWVFASSEEKQVSADYMAEAFLNDARLYGAYVPDGEDVESYLIFWADLFLNYETSERQESFQECAINMIEEAEEDGRITSGLLLMEIIDASYDGSFQVLEDKIVELHAEKLKMLFYDDKYEEIETYISSLSSKYANAEKIIEVQEDAKKQIELGEISSEILALMKAEDYAGLAAYFTEMEIASESLICYQDGMLVGKIESGIGLIWKTDGRAYLGEISENRPSGQGLQYGVYGGDWWYVDGQWNNGSAEGKCIYRKTLLSGTDVVYSGNFVPENNKSYADGTMTAEWEDNKGTFIADNGTLEIIRTEDNGKRVYCEVEHSDGSTSYLFRSDDSKFSIKNLFS